MIVIFYGTSAELIKMVGIVRRIPRSEVLLICSSQHHNGLKKLHKQLDIYPDLDLSRGWFGSDVKNIAQMAGMMAGAHLKFARHLIPLKRMISTHDKQMGTKSIAVVHGDTLTTVAGSYLGRLLGLPVAHIEAGLRTHNWRSPFPEELDRRIAAKFARYHFAPSDLAESDLRKENVRGEIINTAYNTAKDAIELSKLFISDSYRKLNLPKAYCLVLLHRTELIENRSDFEAILKVLNDHAATKTPIVFTEHSTTKEKLKSYGFEHYLEKEGLVKIPKQAYFDFMEIVRNAAYIVTDGGGLQEDAYFMGIPAIIHRQTTERQDGLGFNAELSKMDVRVVANFLKNHKDKSDFKRSIENISPSQIVVDTFASKDFFKK
jgi:UDP-N-acetylglucosamine 2-epimerase (non-hydrolysing)